MKFINILDSDTINKIAAGEVVERPSSVVKELVENAIDAKATAITIEIKEGGISMIRVTDNGSGIEKDDIENAFLRHATSKIKTAMDLMTVGSLGFRGEALSSIASVSQVELITKTHQALLGLRYCIHGGVRQSFEEIGSLDGTTIIVRNLFYNTPARRKFLKTPQTEASYISELVDKIALSHPEISIRFIHNQQNKLHSSGNGQLKDLIYQIYGRDVTAQLLKLEKKTDLLSISGYLGKPILSRGNRAWENYFINGRYIKSAIITKAIEDAYKTFVMIHKYPFTAFNIEIDPSWIDVNVHPRKMEIRFNQNEAVYQQVYQAIRDTLEQKELIPSVTITKEAPKKVEKQSIPEPFEKERIQQMAIVKEKKVSYIHDQMQSDFNAAYKVPTERVEQSTVRLSKKQDESVHRQAEPIKRQIDSVKDPIKSAERQVEIAKNSVMETVTAPQVQNFEQMQLFDGRLLDKKSRIKHRMIGQIFDTYWMIEYDEKLYIIDQHAAHEKVLYEQLMQQFEQRTLATQILSPPIILTLTMREEQIFQQYAEYFRNLCFEIEAFGGKEYAIRGIPLQLFGMNAKDMFIEILDHLSEESKKIDGTIITDRIATMACKAAVKGNHQMSVQEADQLIELLLAAEHPYTCPHGRPTIISISKYEMEKRFKRIQN